MQLQRHIELAKRLERFGEDQLAPVNVEALALEEVDDVRCGDRAIELLRVADAAGDGDVDGGQPRGDGLGCRLLLASRDSMIFRSRSTCLRLPSVAGSASFRGSR